jgi:murein DD-endopeptidase MepM/ murein hydrolase activator NlpD
MPGPKYKFNPKTLIYEPVNNSAKKVIGSIVSFIVSTVAIFVFLYFLVFQNFFDTPEEKMLKRENSQLLLQIKALNQNIDEAYVGINDLKERDKKIYRALLGGQTIPDEIWEAGFGGSDRYEGLSNLKNSEILVETNKKLDKLHSQINIQKQSYNEVINLAVEQELKMRSIPAIQPVSNKDLKRFASGWGMRTHPIYKIPRFHHGIDFTAPKGTDVYATGDGIIESAKKSGTYGNVIVVNHGYGIKTLYAHLDDFNVKKGQKVKRGEVIGFVGNTGQSVGDHLHYEVIVKGKKVNPIHYFFNDLSVEEFEKMIKMSALATKSLD